MEFLSALILVTTNHAATNKACETSTIKRTHRVGARAFHGTVVESKGTLINIDAGHTAAGPARIASTCERSQIVQACCVGVAAVRV